MSTSRATGLLAEEPEDDDHRQKITAELKARGNEAWKPVIQRVRKVSAALKAYALLATSADRGAVRDLSKLD